MEYDLIVRGGMVVDGTGLPRRRVDVGVKDGRIARLARLENAQATEEIDASGRIVAPGIIDAHTHYDPQITFDPYATMSCFHGVTTVLAGNCGFSAAPVKTADLDFLKGVFARVEDMDPAALAGVRWDKFETFPEFIAALKGNLGINFACYVGHSNVRRWVMGEAASERDCLIQSRIPKGQSRLPRCGDCRRLTHRRRPLPSGRGDFADAARTSVVGRIALGSDSLSRLTRACCVDKFRCSTGMGPVAQLVRAHA